MMVKEGGISRYSAITFTPPSDMSVIVQSRGKPVPSWIFARLLHGRRSLLRRFASMSILSPVQKGLFGLKSFLAKNYWSLPSGDACNLTILFELFLPTCSDMFSLEGAFGRHYRQWRLIGHESDWGANRCVPIAEP
jgi:hypothetical protein